MDPAAGDLGLGPAHCHYYTLAETVGRLARGYMSDRRHGIEAWFLQARA